MNFYPIVTTLVPIECRDFYKQALDARVLFETRHEIGVQTYASMRTLVHMGYALLTGAIAAEVAATTAMKYSDGFSRLWPSLLTLLGYVIAFVLLAQTLKTVSVGTAYAIWAGAGTAAIAAIGTVFLGEGMNGAKLTGIALIIGGVVVLNLGGVH